MKLIRNQAFDPFDISIGDCSGEELRRICQEAIARGEARDRAKRLAWKKAFRRALFLAVATVALFAALYLCRDFNVASRRGPSRVMSPAAVLVRGGR